MSEESIPSVVGIQANPSTVNFQTEQIANIQNQQH